MQKAKHLSEMGQKVENTPFSIPLISLISSDRKPFLRPLSPRTILPRGLSATQPTVNGSKDMEGAGDEGEGARLIHFRDTKGGGGNQMKKDGHGVRSALLMVSKVPPLPLLITIVLARTNKNGPPADNRQRRRRPISLSIPMLFLSPLPPSPPPAPLPHIFLTTTCFSSSLSKPPSLPPSLATRVRSFAAAAAAEEEERMERRRRKKRCLKDPPSPPPPSDLLPPLPLLLVLDRPAASPKKSSFLCSLHPFPFPRPVVPFPFPPN